MRHREMSGQATDKLWAIQNRHPGDREGLFAATAELLDGDRVLYPGSYVDVAASFVFPDVTYVDSDARAKRFFADGSGVERIVAANKRYGGPSRFTFIHADYGSDLGFPGEGFDLLVSLYAGFVSRACKQHLRTGGLLLANNSHGDAGMASIDPDFELAAVVEKRDGAYRPSTQSLDRYLIPKRNERVTAALLQRMGRGVAYTRSPATYVFRKASG